MSPAVLIDNLAKVVQTQRLLRNLSQKDLAKLAGVHWMSISKLERGIVAAPSVPLLDQIAQGLSATNDPDEGKIAAWELLKLAQTGKGF